MKLSSLPTLSQHISAAPSTFCARRHARALLLTGLITISLVAGVSSAQAQLDATLNLKSASGASRVFTGQVLGASGGNVKFRSAEGEVSIPLANVTVMQIGTPKEFEEANQAFGSGNNALALAKYSAVVSQYNGLPTTWMSASLARLGEVYINLSQYDKAGEIFADYTKIFGAGEDALPQADLGKAQIAFAKGNQDEAKTLLEGVVERSKSMEAVNEEQSSFFARAFLTLGQVQEASGDHAQALESYLKVVTLYYRDPTLVKAAEARAKALRDAQPTVSVP